MGYAEAKQWALNIGRCQQWLPSLGHKVRLIPAVIGAESLGYGGTSGSVPERLCSPVLTERSLVTPPLTRVHPLF